MIKFYFSEGDIRRPLSMSFAELLYTVSQKKRNRVSWQKFSVIMNNLIDDIYMPGKLCVSSFIWCATYGTYFKHDWIRTMESGVTNIQFARINLKFGWVLRVVNVLIFKKDKHHIKVHIFIFYMTPHAKKINDLCQRTSTMKTCLISARMSESWVRSRSAFLTSSWQWTLMHEWIYTNMGIRKQARSGKLLIWAGIKHVFIVFVLWHI